MAKAIQISEVQDGDHIRTTVLLDDGRIFYRYSENNWKETAEAPWMKERAAPLPATDPDKPHVFVSRTGGGVPTDRRCGVPGCNRADYNRIHLPGNAFTTGARSTFHKDEEHKFTLDYGSALCRCGKLYVDHRSS